MACSCIGVGFRKPMLSNPSCSFGSKLKSVNVKSLSYGNECIVGLLEPDKYIKFVEFTQMLLLSHKNSIKEAFKFGLKPEHFALQC